MGVYNFAFKLKSKLKWFSIEADNHGEAIKKMREGVGPDIEPYAGPVAAYCRVRDCEKPADALYGEGKWLPLCKPHSYPFPHDSRLLGG